MRSVRLVCAAMSLLGAAPLEAAPRAIAPPRVVELIAMDGRRVSPPPIEAKAPQSEGNDPELPVADDRKSGTMADFRIHDLSRRWVEFQMHNSFGSLDSSVAPVITEADPFAHIGLARVANTLNPVPSPLTSSIPVPSWMTDAMMFSHTNPNSVSTCGAIPYRPAGFLTAAAELRRSGYYAMMRGIACQYGLPSGLFDAMIIRESGYRAFAYSPKNAFGLTQLMPQTAYGLGVDRYNIEQNLRGGARYLRQQLDRFGQVHLALAAYNAGPGRVRNGVLPPIPETLEYVNNVLLNWRRLSSPDPTSAATGDAVQRVRQQQAIAGRVTKVEIF